MYHSLCILGEDYPSIHEESGIAEPVIRCFFPRENGKCLAGFAGGGRGLRV